MFLGRIGFLVAVFCLSLACPSARAGGCNLLVRGHAYQQHHVVAQAVIQHYQPVYYAGRDLELEALAEKLYQRLEKRDAIRQAQQQKAAPAPEPITRPTTNAFAKCASCHTGANAAGGLVLDGVTKISCHAYARWGLMAAKGKDVPQQMRALVAGMSNEEKGQLNLDLLDLVEHPAAEGDLE